MTTAGIVLNKRDGSSPFL